MGEVYGRRLSSDYVELPCVYADGRVCSKSSSASRGLPPSYLLAGARAEEEEEEEVLEAAALVPVTSRLEAIRSTT